MPIKKIEIHGLNPNHPLAQVVDEINANLDNILEHVNGIDAETGVVGPTGAKGDKGDPGQQGIEGPRGEQGPKGDKGDPGEPGKNGTNGQDGKDGANGATGSQGEQGIQGPKGDTGATGAQGIQGLKGDTGATGATGPQGIQGPKGDTGAQGPAGVGIKGFASGYVDAGQFVTLDNLKFTVTTGGNRGLSCATVSGTTTLAISATFGYISGVGGSATNWSGNPVYTTTPSGSWFGWSFPNAGDGSTYLIREISTDRFYRVNLMIGPGYTKNFICIERLY